MINITYLKYFYDAIRLESVSKAAKQNYVTQSAVSQGIIKLEKSFNSQLLSHKSNTIKITPEGRKVFDTCRSLFQTIDNLIQSINHNESEYSGEVTFSCTHSMALSILPQVLKKLHAAAPNIKPIMTPGHVKMVKEWLRQGKIEFGIVLENEDVSSLDRIPLYSGNFGLFQSCKRKKTKDPFTAVISTESRTEVNQMRESYYKKYGVKLKTLMEISSWEIIATLAAGDVGVGFIPDFLALSPNRSSKLIPCKHNIDPIPYTLSVVYNKDEELSRNAKLFISLFQEILKVPEAIVPHNTRQVDLGA